MTKSEQDLCNLIDALEWMIEAFCPGDDWKDIPVRKAADEAILEAKQHD